MNGTESAKIGNIEKAVSNYDETKDYKGCSMKL
jgi:hypothetical protein